MSEYYWDHELINTAKEICCERLECRVSDKVNFLDQNMDLQSKEDFLTL